DVRVDLIIGIGYSLLRDAEKRLNLRQGSGRLAYKGRGFLNHGLLGGSVLICQYEAGDHRVGLRQLAERGIVCRRRRRSDLGTGDSVRYGFVGSSGPIVCPVRIREEVRE